MEYRVTELWSGENVDIEASDVAAVHMIPNGETLQSVRTHERAD